ncbi:MAG: glycerophosphodiester phosphodiesterase family protein [Pirellulaceae bacterium]|nr:hypothetical protein [Planctomycetales bacterium]
MNTFASPVAEKLVAHRGYPQRYPENTLPGLLAAMELGAQFVELDVQLSRDLVPFVVHDSNMSRTGGASLAIADHNANEVSTWSAGYHQRFGDEFAAVTVPTLEQFKTLLHQFPSVCVFVEIKQHAIDVAGEETVAGAIASVLTDVMHQAVVISMNQQVLRRMRSEFGFRIGWVLPQGGEERHRSAIDLSPEFLFCDVVWLDQVDVEPWQADWRLAVYTINNAAMARRQWARGVDLVETDNFGDMLPALTAAG